MTSQEEIKSFLEGNDPEKYIVAVEYDYVSDKIFKIKEIPIFWDLKNLQTLDLANNEIRKIPENFDFKNLETLNQQLLPIMAQHLQCFLQV